MNSRLYKGIIVAIVMIICSGFCEKLNAETFGGSVQLTDVPNVVGVPIVFGKLSYDKNTIALKKTQFHVNYSLNALWFHQENLSVAITDNCLFQMGKSKSVLTDRQ